MQIILILILISQLKASKTIQTGKLPFSTAPPWAASKSGEYYEIYWGILGAYLGHTIEIPGAHLQGIVGANIVGSHLS